MSMYYASSSVRSGTWRPNDYAYLFKEQRRLFQKENKVATQMAKLSMRQRAEIEGLLVQAQLLWEAATHYQVQSTRCGLLTALQQRAKDAHAAGNPILAQVEMLEARRLAYQYSRMTEECQRLITEAQAMALSERECAAMDRRRLRQEFAVRAAHFV